VTLRFKSDPWPVPVPNGYFQLDCSSSVPFHDEQKTVKRHCQKKISERRKAIVRCVSSSMLMADWPGRFKRMQKRQPMPKALGAIE